MENPQGCATKSEKERTAVKERGKVRVRKTSKGQIYCLQVAKSKNFERRIINNCDCVNTGTRRKLRGNIENVQKHYYKENDVILLVLKGS